MKYLLFCILVFHFSIAAGQFNYANWKLDIVKDTNEITVWRYNMVVRSTDTIQEPLPDTSHFVTTTSTDFEFPDTVLFTYKKYEHGLLVYESGYFLHIDAPWYLYKHYRYDKKNRMIASTEYSADSNWFETNKIQFDDQRKRVVALHFEDKRLSQKTVWSYDKTNHLRSVFMYWGDGRLMGWRTFHHSRNGLQVTASSFNSDSTSDGFTVYVLDRHRRTLERSLYSRDSIFEQATCYVYNANGSLERKTWFIDKKDKVREIVKYEYSHAGRLTAQKLTGADGEIIELKRYYYNIYGHIDSVLSYEKQRVLTAKYKYQIN